MIFRELSKEEYEMFLKNCQLKTFFQDNKMDNYSKLNNVKSYYVGIENNGKIIAATRLTATKTLFGKYFFNAPRGLLVDYNDYNVLKFFVSKLKKYIKKRSGYVLKIDPYIEYKSRDINGNIIPGIDNTKIVNDLKKIGFIHNGFTRGYDLSGQGRWYFVLNLKNKSIFDINKSMKPNHRNIIKKAGKYGIEVKEISYDELSTFKYITQNTSDRIGFTDKSLVYYQTMYDSFKDSVKFLIAYLNVEKYKQKLREELSDNTSRYEKTIDKESGKAKEILVTINGLKKRLDECAKYKNNYIPVSCAMFMLYGNEVDYLFSGSIDEYKNLYAQYLIQWYMINYAVSHNYEKYNFFGISGIFDKNDKEYGVYEFKKGFGGNVVELIGDFYLPISLLYKIKKILKG